MPIEDAKGHLHADAGSPEGGQFVGKLNPDEQKAVARYTAIGEPKFGGKVGEFVALNKGLRAGQQVSPKLVADLDSAIDKFPLEQDTVLYRGMGRTMSTRLRKAWEDNNGAIEFKDKAFVSTSSSAKDAADFSKNLMEIHVPKGTKALPIGGAENEVLLGRNHKFRVTSFKKTPAGWTRIGLQVL